MSNVDIYTILASKPHNKHYLRRYYTFILACSQANSSLPDSTYTEKHHICPKAKDLFPEYAAFKDCPWNKAILTARQHFIAHWMLWKAYGGSQSQAFNRMRNSKQNDGSITSTMYSHLRQDLKEFLSERPISDETRKKMSESARNRPPITDETRLKRSLATKGKSKSQEHKDKIGNSNRGRKVSDKTKKLLSDKNKGNELSDSTKRKISDFHKGKLKSEETKRRMSLSKSKKQIYHFFNRSTAEEFIGTRYEFTLEKGFSLDTLFQTKANKTCKGWSIKENNQFQTEKLLDIFDEVFHKENQKLETHQVHL